jgi:hypothetical protein
MRQPRAPGSSRTIILVIKPSGRAGRFLGYIGDQLIVTSRQPFLHANLLSFVTTTIGQAAGLSVVDAAQGTRVRKFASGEAAEFLDEAAE